MVGWNCGSQKRTKYRGNRGKASKTGLSIRLKVLEPKVSKKDIRDKDNYV